MSSLDVFDIYSRDYARERFETMSLRDWLLAARDDKMFYASPAERMVAAYDAAFAQGLGAVQFEGAMIDVPVVQRAQNVLARAAAIKRRMG